jgi:hypothetical protein
MRKSLVELQEIDRYLLREMPAGERLLFQARVLISPGLGEKVEEQRRLHQLMVRLGREDRRTALDELHQELMRELVFRNRITAIFNG